MNTDNTSLTSASVSKHALAVRMRKHNKHNRAVQKEIKELQQSPHLIIPQTSFSRVVHEMLHEHGDYSIRSDAVKALQYAAEDCMSDIFCKANNVALFSGRETVTEKDVQFIQPRNPPTEEHSELPLIVPDL